MDTCQEEMVQKSLESAFSLGSTFSCRLNPPEESSLITFSAYANAQQGKNMLKLAVYRLKSASTASLNDAAALIPSLKKDKSIPVLLTSPLSEKKQDLLRSKGMCFIDDTGNAWISALNIHIDIRGRKASSKKVISEQTENVFADKATLILRVLLDHEPLGIRAISRLAQEKGGSLSPGYISKVVSSLICQGYAVKHPDGAISLRRKKDMLDDWSQAYAKLKPTEARNFFMPLADMGELTRKASQASNGLAVLSDQAGASLVDPFASFDSVVLLTRNIDETSKAIIAAGAQELERGANIKLIQPRYRVSAFYGVHWVEGCYVAADLQLYLDLTRQPKRDLEAAEHLFHKKLSTLFSEEGASETATLNRISAYER